MKRMLARSLFGFLLAVVLGRCPAQASADERRANERISLLVLQLETDDDGVQRRAMLELAALGPQAGSAVPALIARLEDPGEGEHVRMQAARTLPQIDVDGKKCLAALRHIAGDIEHLGLANEAVRAMAALGPAASDAAGDLVLMLSRGVPRGVVLTAFHRIGPRAAPVVLGAARTGEDNAPLAAWCLICMGPGAEPAIDTLIEELENARTRRDAILLLSRLAPVAGRSRAALERMVAHGSVIDAQLAAEALAVIEAANREELLVLRRKYFGHIRTGRTSELGAQVTRMTALLAEWDPTGAPVEDLLAIGGPPSRIDLSTVTYSFDTGDTAQGFLFDVREGKIVSWVRRR
jgi:hypothetical protein